MNILAVPSRNELGRRIDEEIDQLASTDSTVAVRAEHQLVKHGEASVDALIAGTASSNSRVRARSIYALGQIAAKRAFRHVVERLHDPEYAVRYDAVIALGNIGHVGAISHLIEILKDPTVNGELASAAAMALVKFGSAAVMPLVSCFDIDARDVRVFAAYTLGHIEDESAIEYLAQLAQSSDDEVRLAAIEAIAVLHTTRSKGLIAKYINDPSSKVRDIAQFWVSKL